MPNTTDSLRPDYSSNSLLPDIPSSDLFTASDDPRELAIALAFEGLNDADVSTLTHLTPGDLSAIDSRLAAARAARRLAILKMQWTKAHEGNATILAALVKAERADVTSEDTQPLLDEKVG